MFFASLALSLPLCVWRGGVIHRRGARISAASTQVGPRATLPDVGGFCWGFFCVGGGGGGRIWGRGVWVWACGHGSLPNFLGCSLDPLPSAIAIKCHQQSKCNSAGSSVGFLSPPRATPRLGGAAVSCQYFPCSFVLALRELGLRLGVKAPLPLRASSRGVLPGAGALAGYRTPIQPVCSISARPSRAPNRDRHYVLKRVVCRLSCSAAPANNY
jgi:hypothetical protein